MLNFQKIILVILNDFPSIFFSSLNLLLCFDLKINHIGKDINANIGIKK